MKASSSCRSCHAPVRWVFTLPKMKRAPIDPDPVPDGNMWVDHWEAGTPVMAVGLNHDAVPRSEPFSYYSHFVTCVHAAQWRKEGTVER